MSASSIVGEMSEDFRRFVLSSTGVGRIITDYGESSLTEYLRHLPRHAHSLPDNEAARALVGALRARVEQDYGKEVAAQALAEFSGAPMIQMADGADLLLDLETLLNHFMYQIGCREANMRYMWTQQCTTVRAITSRSSYRGAAFLETDVDVFSVLEGSRRHLSHANIACMGRGIFTLQPLGVKTSAYAQAVCPQLLAPFRGREFDRAAEGILAANRTVWAQLRMRSRGELILFDEDVTVDVVRRQLELQAEPLCQLLLDRRVRTALLRARAEIVQGRDNLVLRDTTDFFWSRDGERLRPCRVVGHDESDLIIWEAGAPKAIPLVATSLIALLQRRQLYPDLMLAYIALVLLPGAVAVGGASQQEYLPRIREILTTAHRVRAFLTPEDHDRLSSVNYSRLVGPALLELSLPQRRALLMLSEDTDLDRFEADAFAQPVRMSGGSLEYLRYLYRLWKGGRYK